MHLHMPLLASSVHYLYNALRNIIIIIIIIIIINVVTAYGLHYIIGTEQPILIIRTFLCGHMRCI